MLDTYLLLVDLFMLCCFGVRRKNTKLLGVQIKILEVMGRKWTAESSSGKMKQRKNPPSGNTLTQKPKQTQAETHWLKSLNKPRQKHTDSKA